jgi:sugar lactone lactonase YvrE
MLRKRLLKYDAKTKHVTVLKNGLPYPNSAPVSHDRTYVVVAHTIPCQVHMYYLQGPKGLARGARH